MNMPQMNGGMIIFYSLVVILKGLLEYNKQKRTKQTCATFHGTLVGLRIDPCNGVLRNPQLFG